MSYAGPHTSGGVAVDGDGHVVGRLPSADAGGNDVDKSGKVIELTLKAATKALEGVELLADLTYDPLDSANPDDYPIAASTWMVVHTSQADRAKGEALKAGSPSWWATGRSWPRRTTTPPCSAFTDKAKTAISFIPAAP